MRRLKSKPSGTPMEVGQDTHGSCPTAGGDNSHTVGASKTLRAPQNCLDGSLAGRDWGWRSQPMGHHIWKPLKARAEVSPAPLSLPLPPSGSKALTHLHFCGLLDRNTQEKEKKIKTWSNLCILSAFSSWHRGVVLRVYYNLPNNTADNYYNFYF